MPKFRFELETLLKVRLRKEEVAQQEFGKANQVVQDWRKKIQTKEDEIALAQEQKSSGGAIHPQLLAAGHAWYFHLLNEKKEWMQKLGEAKGVAEEKRQLLLMAQMERKALDKLKERKHEAFLEEVKKKEQSFSDEMGSIRHFRKSMFQEDDAE